MICDPFDPPYAKQCQGAGGVASVEQLCLMLVDMEYGSFIFFSRFDIFDTEREGERYDEVSKQ